MSRPRRAAVRHGGGGRPADRPPRSFWPAVAVGWVVMAAGVWGLVSDAGRTRPGEAARFVLGAAVVHDLVVAPAVVVAGWALARLVPAPARGAVQAAAVVSAVVVLFSVPFVRGYGRVSTNPSILPRDYGAGLALVLAGVWSVAALEVVRRTRRARGSPGRRQPSPPASAPGAPRREGRPGARAGRRVRRAGPGVGAGEAGPRDGNDEEGTGRTLRPAPTASAPIPGRPRPGAGRPAGAS